MTQTIALGAFTGSAIDNDKRVSFNTKINLRKTLPRLLAPLLSGIVVLYSHFAILLIVDFISFFVSLYATFKLPDLSETVKPKDKFSFGYYHKLLKYIAKQSEMVYSLISLQIAIIGISLLGVYIIPLILWKYDSFVSGCVIASGALGSLLGGRISKKYAQNNPEKFLLVSLLIQGAALILCSLTSKIFFLGILMFSYFFFVPVQNGCSYTIWQNKTDKSEYGRMLSVKGLMIQITTVCALFLSGILIDNFLLPFFNLHKLNFNGLPANISIIYLVLILFGMMEVSFGIFLFYKMFLKNNPKVHYVRS